MARLRYRANGREIHRGQLRRQESGCAALHARVMSSEEFAKIGALIETEPEIDPRNSPLEFRWKSGNDLSQRAS